MSAFKCYDQTNQQMDQGKTKGRDQPKHLKSLVPMVIAIDRRSNTIADEIGFEML